MRTSLKAVALTAGIFVSISAYAQEGAPPPPPPPNYRPPPPPGYAPRWRDPTAFRHLGLYLRFDAGLGFLSSSGDGLTLSGGAGFAGFSLGGSIAPGVIIAGDFFGAFAPNPNISFTGTGTIGNSGFDLNLYGIGPQLTYYFLPSNMYVSGTLALTRLTESQDGIDYTASDVGIGGRVSLGKEWWVTPHWGVGLAGQFYFSSNDAAGAGSTRISTWGAALAFSATLN